MTNATSTDSQTRAPNRSGRAILLASILLLSVGCDQGTKWWAENSLDRTRMISLAGDTFRLQYAENPGAFLGLGGNMSKTARFWLLTAVNGVFLVVIGGVLLFRWQMHPAQFVALGLLLSGGIGNLIDRITQNGFVTDFLNVGVGPIRTGIFNVADMAIMAGAGLLFWLSFQGEPTHETAEDGA